MLCKRTSDLAIQSEKPYLVRNFVKLTALLDDAARLSRRPGTSAAKRLCEAVKKDVDTFCFVFRWRNRERPTFGTAIRYDMTNHEAKFG